MSKYIINVSFQTRVNKTTRTLEIAESFGLGLDEKEWTLYDNLELEVKQGDVVYITGQSGSGKSVVLRELQRQMKDEGLSVAPSMILPSIMRLTSSISWAKRPAMRLGCYLWQV